MAAPLMNLADVFEIRDGADPRPVAASIPPPFELHRRFIDAVYARTAGVLLGFRYGARIRVGPRSDNEFMVLRVRPWWSRAGLKVIVHFGIPPRRRVSRGAK